MAAANGRYGGCTQCALWVRAILFLLQRGSQGFEGMQYESYDEVKGLYASSVQDVIDKHSESLPRGSRKVKRVEGMGVK